MTDLEKLWDDMPTAEPPVDAILAAGRHQIASRRRRRSRPLMAVGTVAALLATFVAGTQVGGTDRPGPTSRVDAVPVAFQADLDPAASCDELLDSYRERGLAQVTEWGWGTGGVYPFSAQLDSIPASGKYGATKAERTASTTGTNVQEAAVDEPDTVKTDGTRIVRLRQGRLMVYDATGAEMRTVSTTALPTLDDGEILLVDDVVVVIGNDRVRPRDRSTGHRPGGRVITISLADPAKPVIASDVAYSSRVLSARQHGSVVRLVLAAGLPDLDFATATGREGSRRDALATNRRLVTTSTIEDWLPTYDTGDGPKPLLDCTLVAIPSDDVGLDTVSVVGLDVSDPTDPQAIGLAGASTIAYESADHLYLASSPSTFGCFDCGFRAQRFDASDASTSHVFQFDLDGRRATHVASGEIAGAIADRWSLDEAGGVLRAAIAQTSASGRDNAVVTMRRSGTRLVELGRVDGLGPGEDIKSVRWFDDLAIVVTFREVDPLYTVDLGDPSAPTLLGELKIPGFSAYLHPVGQDQLLGIGYGGRGFGPQIALFDVSDLADVRREDVQTYRRGWAVATNDPRAFTWLPEQRTALTVLQRGRSVYIASIRVVGSTLASTLTRVDRGYDADVVRTLALADGRVVVVTRTGVQFFDVP